MSYWKNDGIKVHEYVYDFALHGGAKNVDIEISNASSRIPVGSIIVDCHIVVEDAVVGSTSTLGIGNITDNDGYIPATAEATLAANYVGSAAKNKGALLWDDTNDNLLPYRVADSDKSKVVARIGTNDLTAGRVRVFMWFLAPSAQDGQA